MWVSVLNGIYTSLQSLTSWFSWYVSFFPAELHSCRIWLKISEFQHSTRCNKIITPPLQLKVQMISQNILYQIKAHEKLHLWVQLEQLLRMKLLKCLELHAKMHSYFTIFILHIDISTKNNSESVISIKNCVDWYINRDISVQKMLWHFCLGYSHDASRIFAKIFFVKNIQMTRL